MFGFALFPVVVLISCDAVCLRRDLALSMLVRNGFVRQSGACNRSSTTTTAAQQHLKNRSDGTEARPATGMHCGFALASLRCGAEFVGGDGRALSFSQIFGAQIRYDSTYGTFG